MTAADTRKCAVSVVIPTHNRDDLVARAVSSVLKQTLPPMEVIVVDDYSSDTTTEALAPFGDRIRVIRSERNVERGAARNIGARAARGKLLAFLDSDDEWRSDKLARQLSAAGEKVASVTGIDLIDVDGTVVRAPYVPPADAHDRIFVRNLYLGSPSSLLISKDTFEKVGGFPEQWAIQGSEDWVFLARLVQGGHRIAVVPVPLVHYRVHTGNATADPDRVAVSMWSAVELMRDDHMVDGAALWRLRGHTAIVIARGFAVRARLRETLVWWRRAFRASDRSEVPRGTLLVAVSLLAGALRAFGLRRRV